MARRHYLVQSVGLALLGVLLVPSGCDDAPTAPPDAPAMGRAAPGRPASGDSVCVFTQVTTATGAVAARLSCVAASVAAELPALYGHVRLDSITTRGGADGSAGR